MLLRIVSGNEAGTEREIADPVYAQSLIDTGFAVAVIEEVAVSGTVPSKTAARGRTAAAVVAQEVVGSETPEDAT